MIENLSIIIPYRNEKAALQRLLKTLPPGVPTIVVDDVSETLPEATGPNVKTIRLPKRGMFAGAVNAGIQACSTDVLVLNQDIWFDNAEWMDVVNAAQNTSQRYAIAGHGVFGHVAWPKSYVQGDFMYLRREAIDAVGLFDGKHWPLWGCTAEWQLRACRKGWAALPLATIPGMGHEERHASKYGAAITKHLQDDPKSQSLMIRTPPLITVVVPTYNQAQYLQDVLGSLIGGPTCLGDQPGQTFQGFEVVIVDDCGKDNTPALMAKLTDPWKGIRYIRHQANKGTAAAINTGVNAGHGKFYTVLAGDDMLEPAALEKMLAVCEANERVVAYADQRIMVNGKRAHVWKMREYDFDELVQRNHVPAGIMTTKAAWKQVGGYPEEFRHGREDWAMAVALGRAGYCGQHIAEPLYIYRRMGQNRSLTNSSSEWRTQFVTMMQQRFPDIYGGERPTMCCGNTQRSGARVAPRMQARIARATIPTPGAQGMVPVEYIGLNLGRTNWQGEVTKTRYTFSASKRVLYVWASDVPGLLKILYDRKPGFRIYTPPTPPPAPEPMADPVTVPVAEPVMVEEPAITETVVEHMSTEPEPVAETEKPKRHVRKAKTADA